MAATSPGNASTSLVKTPRNPVPGPGAHDIPVAFSGIYPSSKLRSTQTFSVPSGRTELAHRQEKGGPAQFFPKLEATVRQAPGARGYTFGGAKRELSNTKDKAAPGPEADQRDGVSYDRTPNYGFGLAQRTFVIPGRFAEKARFATKGFQTPGPGTHDPEMDSLSGRRRVPSYTVQQRREPLIDPPGSVTSSSAKKAVEMPPGPGQYSPTGGTMEPTGGAASRSFRFGNSARVTELKNNTPGPGHYGALTTWGQQGGGADPSAPKWSMPGRDERASATQGLDPVVAHKFL